MCQFQKEINSKIQEKKALQIPADSRCPVVCHSESADGSHLGVSYDRTSGGMNKLEDASDGPDGNSHSATEGSTDAEQRCHCRGKSVGIAQLHGFVMLCAAWVVSL